MGKTIPCIAVAIVLATNVFSLNAQGPTESWKKKNDHGSRYEGAGFQRNVTTFGLNLISLLAVTTPDTRTAIDVSRDDEIVVDFSSHVSGPYLLTARELDLYEYYWMEPKERPVALEGPNTFRDVWKTNVLRELKSQGSRISTKGLGVRIWFKTEADVEHVAPAIMRAAGSPRPQTTGTYQARFLPDVTFDRVSFSVRAGCQLNTGNVFPGGGSIGRQRARTSFPVDFSVPRDYSGMVMLEITTTRFASANMPSAGGEKQPDPDPTIEKSWYCFTQPPVPR